MKPGFLALAFAVILACPCPAATRPNILLILADDMRMDSIAALGNPAVHTPHLDQLAARSLSFRNAYCQGGNSPAVCTPSRNMLLSGQSFFRWGGRPTTSGAPPNLPLSFRDAGYVTYHHGKKGNSAPAIQARFEINKTLADDDAERKSGEPGRIIVDDAIAFLRRQAGPERTRPFFMYLAPGNPHDPRVAAPAYLAAYDAEALPLPRNYLPVHPFDNGEMTVRDEQLLPWPRTAPDVRRTLRDYYSTITGLDFHLGRLFRELEALRLVENTVVIFTADQGISVGSHGLLGKQNLYDHAMKVPMLMAGPGIRAGRTEALVYLLDLYPTLCDIAGMAVPRGLDGRSFQPVLAGNATSARSELFLAYMNVQRAWRDARWKIIRYPQIQLTQLFDLRADPDEMQDLATQPRHAARVRAMLQRLEKAQSQWGDTLPLTVSPAKPSSWQPKKSGPGL